jgi:hypothetical protein
MKAQDLTDEQVRRLALAELVLQGIEYWNDNVRDAEPDERYCCTGEYCGCGGMSNREHWEMLAGLEEIDNET